jgi:energy-coupling factor transport system substrate-specific component
MSWPLASFSIVGLVLLAGWLAYERARPSARMVAVVATLAAVAALGRDAFVALPEVKPITAFTLVVGYALGPLPGFTVGALGMLASNMMLGQGSYTPWQMAAWGMVGLAGDALGRLTNRRLGRLQLACACGLAGLAATEVMNVYTWTIGATHTAAAFLLIAGGTALPFNLVDAGASFFFGLAFAPELARVLARMRARMDVHWEPAAGALLVAVLLVNVAPARAARVNVSRELAYLASAQDSDGGFGSASGQASSELYTGWVAIGLAAAGRNPATLRRDGHSVLDALRAQAGTLEGPGDLERTILALRACGAPVGALAGRSLVGGLLRYRQSDGAFAGEVVLSSFAIFALRAAGISASGPTLAAAARWIAHQQNPDGGFSFAARGSASDVDDTGAALQGLIDAGVARGSVAVARAVSYLEHAQNLDGGLPMEPGEESNAQSTAWAIQGLVAAGRDVESVRRSGSRSPLGYLQSLLAPNGSVRYSRTSAQAPVWVTAQALAALAEAPLPVGPVR